MLHAKVTCESRRKKQRVRWVQRNKKAVVAYNVSLVILEVLIYIEQNFLSKITMDIYLHWAFSEFDVLFDRTSSKSFDSSFPGFLGEALLNNIS